MTGTVHVINRLPQYMKYHLKSEVAITFSLPVAFNRYTAVQINDCLKRTSAIKEATTITDNFHYKCGSYHVPTTKTTLFMVNKDAKEGTGKSIKNVLHVQQYGKRH